MSRPPPLTTPRDLAKKAIYNGGLFATYHRRKNATHLTIVMFHRVLPRPSAEWDTADRLCAMPTDVFAHCLDFFRAHYNTVTLAQVEDATCGGAPLPERPLLITFDDGWTDTLEHAAPLLARAGLPAACFLVAGTLDDPAEAWWQDDFVLAWQAGRVNATAIRSAWEDLALESIPGVRAGDHDFLSLLSMLQELPPDVRGELIGLAPTRAPGRRQLVSSEQVRNLIGLGIGVGAHGWSHVPLPWCREPYDDLRKARDCLNAVLAGCGNGKVLSQSFPHGRYDISAVQAARRLGFRLNFTSEPSLVPLRAGRPVADVFGRVEIPYHCVADASGAFQAHLLAFHLFTREARVPAAALAA